MLTYGNHFIGKRNNYGLDSDGIPYSGFGKLHLASLGTYGKFDVEYTYKGKTKKIIHTNFYESAYDVPYGAKVKFNLSHYGSHTNGYSFWPKAIKTTANNFDYNWILLNQEDYPAEDDKCFPLSRIYMNTSGTFTMPQEDFYISANSIRSDFGISSRYDLSSQISSNRTLTDAIENNGGIGSIEVAPVEYRIFNGWENYTATLDKGASSYWTPNFTGSQVYNSGGVLIKRVPTSFLFEETALKCNYYPSFTTDANTYVRDYTYITAYKLKHHLTAYWPKNEIVGTERKRTYEYIKPINLTAKGYQGHHTGEYGNQPLYISMTGWDESGVSGVYKNHTQWPSGVDDNHSRTNFMVPYNFYVQSGVNTTTFTSVFSDGLYVFTDCISYPPAASYGASWNGKYLSNVFYITNPLSAQQKIPAASMQNVTPANTIFDFKGVILWGPIQVLNYD